MHVEFLQVDGGKMSKSLGNTYILDQLQEKELNHLHISCSALQHTIVQN